MEKLTAGALFAGIGGFCTGLGTAGIPTIWANELDAHASHTYELNHRKTRLVSKDVRDLTVRGDKLEPVDILTAGFPCQSFSQAGDRKGFEDPRGVLFFEILRLVQEFGKNKPKILFLENAPYLRIGDNGGWFMRISEEIRKAGYWFRESNALELELSEATGIPQFRTRLFLVAFSRDHFRSSRMPDIKPDLSHASELSELVDFKGKQEPHYYLGKDNRYYKMILSQTDNKSVKRVYQLRKYFVRARDHGLCPTLTANMGRGGHNVPFVWDRGGLRKLTEMECLKLQGFVGRKSFRFPEDQTISHRYHQIGNAVPPPLVTLIAKQIKKKFAGAPS